MWKEYNSIFPERGWKESLQQTSESIQDMADTYRRLTRDRWSTVIDHEDVKVLYWQNRQAYFIVMLEPDDVD